jgi:hypothetical protein
MGRQIAYPWSGELPEARFPFDALFRRYRAGPPDYDEESFESNGSQLEPGKSDRSAWEMKTYTAVVEQCPDTGLYVGYVPGFPEAQSQAQT